MILPISKLLEGRADPICVKSNQTIREALVLMVENDYSQLPVISDSDELLGIISQESILKR
jgi:CBS domain-containing protein